MVLSPSTIGGCFCLTPILRPVELRRDRSAAFSLVEVTLALGIMSFAFLGLLGMLPIGVSNFHAAMDQSSCSQISQRVLGEAQQTDFDQLIGTPQSVRYFDSQGNELQIADRAKAIYYTNLVTTSTTTLPGSTTPNSALATVFLQIAINPGNQSLPTGTNLHWTAPAGMSIMTYAVNVARNK